MPARSNEYQKLVMLINKSLAAAGARVTESAMLHDPEAGCDREIDILVRSTVLGHEILIGIECTTVAKPVEVRILESFREKHRKVGINKTVVVSKKGFTKSAKEYARKNHIKLLTFEAAGREKWSKIFEPFRSMSIYGRSYRLTNLAIFAGEEFANLGFVFDNFAQVLWRNAFVPVQEFCAELWRDSDVSKSQAKLLRENELNGQGEPWVEVEFDLQKAFVFRDRNGVKIHPDSLSFKMTYVSNYQGLNAREVEYDGNTYVVGAFSDKAKKQFAHLVLREHDGTIRGSLEASANWIPEILKP